MKSLKYSLFTLLTAFVFMGASATAYAQSNTEAYDKYNKAIELASAGEYEQAINTYKQAINLAKELGEKGQEIVQNSKEALPKLYYQHAFNVYTAFKKSPSVSSLKKAISAFETAVAQAKKYGNSDIASQAKGVVTQLYYQKSVLQYRQGNYDAALASINTAIEMNPAYAKAYYHRSLIVKETSSTDDYLAAVDKAIQVAQSAGNGALANQIKQSAAAQLVYIGAQRVQNEKYSSAVAILKRALNYDAQSVNAYYRMAQAYNSKANWQKALDAARQALEYANGGNAAQAKIYFAIGNAYKGLGQYSQACEAYSNANYGRFKRSVQHIKEFVLKCK